MWFVFLLLAIAAPLFVFLLSRTGDRLRFQATEPIRDVTSDMWPSLGLIIPAAGNHPDMDAAIRSLLSQSYPGRMVPVIVTATSREDAADLARRLQADYPELLHVVAGKASGSGQKNHNSIAAVRTLGNAVDVLAFCDSTHMASPDFLRQLVAPIARGKEVFTTGYHEVVPEDDDTVTLAYTMDVIFMRLMQALPGCTQAWGGAMCIRRSTFEDAGIARFWSTNVVDDCSLTTYLAERRIRICPCPGALLRTRASHHKGAVWRAWLDRQILFLKFCVRPQWYQLGALSVAVVLPPVLSAYSVLALLAGEGSGGMIVATALYLGLSALAIARLRPLVARHVRMLAWMRAWLVTCVMFFWGFLRTVPATGILWHGIWYEVGAKGRVTSITRRG